MLPQVVIKPRKALPFFCRHPWVFQGAVAKTIGDPQPGAEVAVHSHEGDFIARGLYNPHSNIRVRLYTWDEHVPLDREFWSQRLVQALELRKQIPELGYDHTTNRWTAETACRLVNSEGDQLSGLTIDRYGDWLLVQMTSLALAQRQTMFLDLFQQHVAPRGIWLRTEKGIRAAEGLDQADGLLWGEAPPRPLTIVENAVRYEVDVAAGQKTGFFLDQRQNRDVISRFAPGAAVLDVCCYSGGFALNALRGGAQSALAVDASASALELAERNAALNGWADRFRTRKGDAFRVLEELAAEGASFDLVILDPPKLARNRNGLDAALRGYISLNQLAIQLVRPGGWLMTCSCSGHVDAGLFVEVVGRGALQAGRHFQLLEQRGPALDHPRSIHCLESDYLKAVFGRVAPRSPTHSEESLP